MEEAESSWQRFHAINAILYPYYRVSLSAQKVWIVLLGNFEGYIYIGHSHDVFCLVLTLDGPTRVPLFHASVQMVP